MDLQTEDILKAKILKIQFKFHREAQSVKTVNLMDSSRHLPGDREILGLRGQGTNYGERSVSDCYSKRTC